jgi:hypothetical protein
LQKGQYRLVGQMIAVCLVQGQVSPRFLSERLYRQVCNLSPLPATLEEVTDYNLRTKLRKASKWLMLIETTFWIFFFFVSVFVSRYCVVCSIVY